MKSIKSFSQFVNENINESGDSFEIPTQIYKIIHDIESRFSFCKNGVVKGNSSYTGDEKANFFSKYVNDTIGYDVWNKLDDKTKSQIYSFAFQSDSSNPYKYFWVKGLAQAVDSTVNRATITPDAAIQIIKSANNLANIYSSYLKVVKNQYNNISLTNGETECNRKKVWKPRPDAIDRMLNGEDHKKVLDDWQKTYIDEATSNPSDINNTSSTETTSTDNSQEKKSGATFRSDSLNGLIKQINQGELVDNRNGFDLSKPVTIDFKEGRYILNAPGGKDGFFTLKLALNIVADNQANSFPAKDSLANQGYKVWNEGTFQLTGEGLRNWALMYKK